jgi:hypothetical protein
MAPQPPDDEVWHVLIDGCTFDGPLELTVLEGQDFSLVNCTFNTVDAIKITVVPKPVTEEEVRAASQRLSAIAADLTHKGTK